MKKLLFILLLPIFSFSQVSSWRKSEPVQSGTVNSSSSNNTFRTTPSDGYSSWRQNPPQNTNPKVNSTITRPYYNNWNNQDRWNMWGAPIYGYNYWLPYTYYDRWGYREPARIYVYNDGRKDTIKGKSLNFSFGIQMDIDKQIGGWLTLGDRTYFILEYSKTYESDKSTFFPDGKRQLVDFPLIDDYIKSNVTYFGFGKKFGRTGVHTMFGFGTEVVRWRGYDVMGYITFPKYSYNFTTIKIGIVRDIKKITTKLDYDPIRKNIFLGVGFNL